ncbi:unnamed protein product [Linum trigynum]|uniref:WAT1-related protein n=1 Tax=Linum trigynum TaxID=586398 RepID=A0AAV2DKF3_9ROSI
MGISRWRWYVAMLFIQLAYGISNILIKISLDKGLNPFVLVVYRHAIAFLLLAPFAYVLERKQRPALSLSVMVKILALSSLGTTLHLNIYYAGLTYTTATVASALSNVIPSLTFAMALLLGMEQVKVGCGRGRAKVLGTMICVAGSLVFTFWKGGSLFQGHLALQQPLLEISYSANQDGADHDKNRSSIKGSALILTSYIAWSGWLILQGIVCKVYPARLSLNAWICFFASIQSSMLALLFARDPALWKLKLEWNVELATIMYCGVVISTLVYYLQTLCISKKGPVFAAMFSPLLLVIVGAFSSIAFAEQLHLGSLVGALIIILGLYSVLWGKSGDHTALSTTAGAGQKGNAVGIDGTVSTTQNSSAPHRNQQKSAEYMAVMN